MTPVLLTTVHDPHGQMLEIAQRELPTLSKVYGGRAIFEITSNTDLQLRNLLADHGYIRCDQPGDIARARRKLLKSGLLFYPIATHYHLVDFDRLLHWWLNYPNELARVVNHLPDHDFAVLGRTSRAMATHPFAQRETERLADILFSLGTRQKIDVLTASRGISSGIAQRIMACSVAEGPAGVDCEWPLIASRFCEVGYIETEGLEYESDTFGIGRTGLIEWQLRLKNLRDAVRVLARWYATDRTGNIRGNAKSAATR